MKMKRIVAIAVLCAAAMIIWNLGMQMVLFIGIQASGKTSFYRDKFFHTHVRISLDMLKTRHREEVLFKACLEAKQPFVIDKMNLSRADRRRYIARAKAAGFAVEGYYFETAIGDALRRNAVRPPAERVPDAAIFRAKKVLEPPRRDEGFDHLYSAQLENNAWATLPMQSV